MKRIFSFAIIMVGMLALACSCVPREEDTTLELVNGSEETMEFNHFRQTASFNINSSLSWKAVSSQDWLVIETAKGSNGEGVPVKFILSNNPDYGYRTAEITVTAGRATLVVTVVQEPEIRYIINENFDSEGLLLESNLPAGWFGDNGSALDVDGDGYCWRCWRDPETSLTYAYSMSYYEDRSKALNPDNWMTSPRFTIPAAGFSLRWDAKGYDPEYLGDKYEVYIATYTDGQPLELIKQVCEEVTTSAEELTPHLVSLDDYVDTRICIAFHHFDCTDLSRVLITNVEVSNRK